MENARYLQEKADRYRSMSGFATNPEIKRQLRLWAREFEVLADSIETNDQTERENRELAALW